MKKTQNLTKQLVESSLMIAFATVLSMLKLVEMPYGGSVTPASMLPILVIAYRHGVGTGLMSGVTYAAIQQLLGLNNLSYVTGWQSVVAVIALDYILAFTVVGLGGIFRGKIAKKTKYAPAKQSAELAVGMIFVCVLRYICHTVAGATVWAGLSIPTEAALIYSVGYNATYMLPETIVSALAAAWIGSIIDLSKKTPSRFAPAKSEQSENTDPCGVLPHFITLISVFVIAFDTLLIAPHLQNAESGAFDFSGLTNVAWLPVIIVSAVGAAAVIGLAIARKILGSKSREY